MNTPTKMFLMALAFCKSQEKMNQGSPSSLYECLWSRKPDGHWRVKLPSESEDNANIWMQIFWCIYLYTDILMELFWCRHFYDQVIYCPVKVLYDADCICALTIIHCIGQSNIWKVVLGRIVSGMIIFGTFCNHEGCCVQKLQLSGLISKGPHTFSVYICEIHTSLRSWLQRRGR